MSKALQAPRGTRDLLPPDTHLWNHVEALARHVFVRYGFGEIRTPIFEQTQLFARGVGEETDIVSKEMFTWEDRGRAASESKGQSLTLRPENTAGVVRAYIEHQLGDNGMLQKLYYIGPQFRRERPQKGRYRQFYQIGAEVIGPPTAGSESPVRDAEVLEMLATFLNELGLAGWTLELNSVGDATDRPRYLAALREALSASISKMCEDCRRRYETNVLRVLDCKVPEDQAIIAALPKIGEFLGEGSRNHFSEVQEILRTCGVPFKINDRLVRGLDYYTRTAFEFTHGEVGAQGSILGGGRYDGLSEALGGPKAPGIGFAIGEDRVIMAFEATAAAKGLSDKFRTPVYVAPLGTGMDAHAAKLAQEIRRYLPAELGDSKFRLKKSFETAERSGATVVIIVGENEVKSGQMQVKDLKTGEQTAVAQEGLEIHLKSTIRKSI